MITFAIGSLSFSLAGLIALFCLKYVELRIGVVYAPKFRMRADRLARMTRVFLYFALEHIERLPHDALTLLRVVAHYGAVLFARGARAAEYGAYRLADRVSHKHHFERGETKSTFLRSVSEHKSALAPHSENLR